MKKTLRLTSMIALVLVLAMALSLCAFASSDEASVYDETVEKTPGTTAPEIIMAALACTDFSDEPLTDEEVDAILAAGVNAPSAFNYQPWKFIVVEDAEMKETLIDNDVATVIIIAVPIDDYGLGGDSQFTAGLAAESMYLYAQAIGLCANMYAEPCGVTINISDESKAEYGIDADWEAAIVLGIGHYNDEVDAYSSASARMDVDSFVSVIG